jgi:hypothetical protein
MQEPTKFCPACRQQNNLSAQFCQKCGLQYTDAPSPPPAALSQPKRNSTLTTLLVVVVGGFGCCIASNFIAKLSPNKTAPSTSAGLTDSPAASGKSEAWIHLTVVKSNWEKGGFGSIGMWKVTFKNNSDRPIGNIQYRTVYYSETGVVVDKGGIDSLLDKKVIQKVVPPKSTRTIEVNDGFIHSESHRASFQLVDCQFVADSR